MKINIKRSGSVHVCFWDVGGNRPVNITSYEDQPVGGFPLTFNSEHELRSKITGYEFNFIDEVREPQPVASRPIDADRQVAQLLRDAGSDATSTLRLVPAALTKAPLPLPPSSSSTTHELEKALGCYRIYLIQLQATEDDARKDKLQSALNACGALIQTVWPGSGERLVEVKKEMELFNV